MISLEMGQREMSPPLNSDQKRVKLMEFIKEHGIVFGEVDLSSKIKSKYYYNLKQVFLHPVGLSLIVPPLLAEVKKFGARSVGGLESGAIPLSMGLMGEDFKGNEYSDSLRSFWVRKEPKEHGLRKRVEGFLVDPVVVVDDVLTSGKSIIKAVDAVLEEGHSVAGVVCIINRQEEGVVNEVERRKIKHSSLFKHSEFAPFINKRLNK